MSDIDLGFASAFGISVPRSSAILPPSNKVAQQPTAPQQGIDPLFAKAFGIPTTPVDPARKSTGVDPRFAAAFGIGKRTSGSNAYAQMIADTERRYNLPAGLLTRVVAAESSFNPRAKSKAGALGLTQLMPGTARDMGVTDPFDPAQSLEGGAKYLVSLVNRYHGDLVKAVAAYNAGPGNVDKHKGVPPFPETQAYVQKVLGGFDVKKGEQHAVPAGSVPSHPGETMSRLMALDPVIASLVKQRDALEEAAGRASNPQPYKDKAVDVGHQILERAKVVSADLAKKQALAPAGKPLPWRGLIAQLKKYGVATEKGATLKPEDARRRDALKLDAANRYDQLEQQIQQLTDDQARGQTGPEAVGKMKALKEARSALLANARYWHKAYDDRPDRNALPDEPQFPNDSSAVLQNVMKAAQHATSGEARDDLLRTASGITAAQAAQDATVVAAATKPIDDAFEKVINPALNVVHDLRMNTWRNQIKHETGITVSDDVINEIPILRVAGKVGDLAEYAVPYWGEAKLAGGVAQAGWNIAKSDDPLKTTLDTLNGLNPFASGISLEDRAIRGAGLLMMARGGVKAGVKNALKEDAATAAKITRDFGIEPKIAENIVRATRERIKRTAPTRIYDFKGDENGAKLIGQESYISRLKSTVQDVKSDLSYNRVRGESLNAAQEYFKARTPRLEGRRPATGAAPATGPQALRGRGGQAEPQAPGPAQTLPGRGAGMQALPGPGQATPNGPLLTKFGSSYPTIGNPKTTTPYPIIRYQTRPGTKDEQFELGQQVAREALSSVRQGGFARYLKGLSISYNKGGKGYDLIGRKVLGTHDLAEMAWILRNKCIEVQRYIFVRDGEIVGHEAASARLPASVGRFPGLDDIAGLEFSRWLKECLRKYRADGFYQLHNHPAGDPTPSKDDFLQYKLMPEIFRSKFLGYMILNSNKYSIINRAGQAETHSVNHWEEFDPLLVPQVPHDMLGITAELPQKILALGQSLKISDDWIPVIGTDTDDVVRAIAEFPASLLLDTTNAGRLHAFTLLRRMVHQTGSFKLHAVVPSRILETLSPRQIGQFSSAIRDNLVYDILDDSGRSLHDSLNISRRDPWEKQYGRTPKDKPYESDLRKSKSS